jgi:hypothetical protein
MPKRKKRIPMKRQKIIKLYIVNIYLGVGAGLFAISADYYHWRLKRAKWKDYEKNHTTP